MEAFAPWIGVALYPVALLGPLVFGIAGALVLGVLGLAAGAALGKGLGYRAALRLSCVAMTPAVITGTLITSLSMPVPYWPQVGLGLTVVYLIYGVACAPKRREAMAAEPA
jgi:hypothetical protein